MKNSHNFLNVSFYVNWFLAMLKGFQTEICSKKQLIS